MAVTANPVAAYRVHFYGHSEAAGADDKDKKADIFLICTEPQQLGPLVGTLSFYSPEVAAGRQDRLDDAGRPQGHLSITELGAVVDVLRHERPLAVMWDDTRQLVWLATSPEPVGEEED